MASQPTTGDPPFRHRTVLRDGEAFDSTFEDWHRRNHVSFKGYLPPKTTKRARTIAPHLRQPIRSMVGLLYDVHEGGHCIKKSTFEMDNVVFSRGRLIFRRVDLENFSESGCLDNFASLKSFIETAFFGGFSNLPVDLVHLLGLLVGNPRDHKMLIYNHVSLMNSKAKRTFIDECFMIQKQYNSRQLVRYIRACGLMSNNSDWETLWEADSPLKEVYDKGIQMNLYQRKRNLIDDQIRFYRNAIAHLIEYCEMGTRSAMYEYDDCLDILLSIPQFAENIARFPEYLHRCKLLETIKFETYFDEQ